jgi:hypothetical protein
MATIDGRCIFCGSDGPLTRGDAIPQWLARVLHDMEPAIPKPSGVSITGGRACRRR